MRDMMGVPKQEWRLPENVDCLWYDKLPKRLECADDYITKNTTFKFGRNIERAMRDISHKIMSCYRITPDSLKSMGLSDFVHHILGIKVTVGQQSMLNALEYGRSPCMHPPQTYGISSPAMGNHLDNIICDDLISDKAFNNITKKKEDKMYETRQYGYDDVTIKRVRNGFIVTVGCETFVANDWGKLSKALNDYYKDPVAAEKKYCSDLKEEK